MTDHRSRAITAVIVNYNAGALLLECIASAISQVERIVLVDNASSDGSVDAIKQAHGDDERLRIVLNETNLGFAAACNLGAKQSPDDELLFLNPDCILEKGTVDRLRSVLYSDARIGMVGGLLLNPDGTEQGGGRRALPTPWRSLVRATGLYRLANRWPGLFFDFHLHKQPLPKKPIEVEAISGACMLVKREAIDDVGLFDEGYFMHCEDLDWCFRTRQKGWKILFVPDAVVVHQKGACSKSSPVFVEWHKHKGMSRFYHKFFRQQYPAALMWLVDLGVWLRFALIAGYLGVKNILSGRRN